MDLTTSTNHIIKSPDSDTDTETPLQTHLTKALSLTNGSYKTHQNHHLPPPPPSQQHAVVSYKECLKNHAATFGGLALDGCGEFMPKVTATPQDPTSLKCAACGCHRNFHRREPFSPTTTTHMPLPPPALNWTTSPSQSPGSTSSGPSLSPTSPASPTPQSFYPSAPHMLLALSATHSGHIDDTQFQKQSYSLAMTNPHGKKRGRTKFSQEQKEKMFLFAERLGWRMLRGNNDRVVEEFCSEIGVTRNVFKIWMHNNRSRKEKFNNSNDKCGFNADEEAGRVGTDNKLQLQQQQQQQWE
ncbi:unnamed protein product [Dovyalis caffra]|uniref:ZF-HD dimerization-type domain-containing protein n=1 Tax=Dovyalis caffra TaxID=77055 RepID=A0AAV1QWC7_9ROSI|nr:unnamed protein product [Dovyalis caffra]